jgi:protein-S-isoprenylcysteine O-methyltransferase Ste14
MLAGVGIAVCVGAVVAVWVAGALYNTLHRLQNPAHAPRERIRSQPGSTALIVVAVACAALAIASRSHFDGLAAGALWVQILGLAVLAASTVFTLWARFSLGTSWSVAPKVQGDHQLRTHGPYAVTRHPIYTGLLGMLLGATLLSGIGQWIVLFPVGLILFEVKIRMEEHLMLATFPDDYPRYRRQVPQLVPGLFALRQRNATQPAPTVDRPALQSHTAGDGGGTVTGAGGRLAAMRTQPAPAGRADGAPPRPTKGIADHDRKSETRALHPRGHAATSLPQAPSVHLPSLGRTHRFADHRRQPGLAPDDHRAKKR